jgi:hypothetical protein
VELSRVEVWGVLVLPVHYANPGVTRTDTVVSRVPTAAPQYYSSVGANVSRDVTDLSTLINLAKVPKSVARSMLLLSLELHFAFPRANLYVSKIPREDLVQLINGTLMVEHIL